MQNQYLLKTIQKRRKQVEKQKTIKLIRNKLSPMAQDMKLPLGIKNFSNFKNLQKIPKLKKKHFTQFSIKSNIQQALDTTIETLEKKENEDHLEQEIYKKPDKWLQIWKKTGDQFQNKYFTNHFHNSSHKIMPKYLFQSPDFKNKERQRTPVLPEFSRTTREVLKKVQIFKKFKNQQIQEKQRFQLNKKPRKLLKNMTELIQNKQRKNDEENTDKKEIKRNQEWVTFITSFLIKKNVQDSQEDKIYAEYKARKKQNKIKQFINLFERETKTNRTYHSYNSSLPSNKFQDDSLKENYCQVRQRVIECNNPVFKLRRLQSLCKISQKSKNLSCQKLQTCVGFTSQRLRINSNHKKIINTQR